MKKHLLLLAATYFFFSPVFFCANMCEVMRESGTEEFLGAACKHMAKSLRDVASKVIVRELSKDSLLGVLKNKGIEAVVEKCGEKQGVQYAFQAEGANLLDRIGTDNPGLLEWWKEEELADDTWRIKSVKFNNSGNRIMAVAGYCWAAKVWRLGDGGWHREAHLRNKEKVKSAVFDPSGSQILITSYDGVAKVWRLEGDREWRPEAELTHIAGRQCVSAKFDAVGSRVVTYGGGAKVWCLDSDKNAWRLESTLEEQGQGVLGVVFDCSGSRVVTLPKGNGGAKIWCLDSDTKGWQLESTLEEGQCVDRVVFDSSGDRVATLPKGDGAVKVWCLKAGTWQCEKELANCGINVEFNAAGDRILVLSKNESARVWHFDAAGWRCEKSLDPDLPGDDTVCRAQFSAAGNRILTRSIFGREPGVRRSGECGGVGVWSLVDGKWVLEAARLGQHDNISSVNFNLLGDRIEAFSGHGNDVKVWRLVESKWRVEAEMDVGFPFSKAFTDFNAAGDRIVCMREKDCRVWRLQKGLANRPEQALFLLLCKREHERMTPIDVKEFPHLEPIWDSLSQEAQERCKREYGVLGTGLKEASRRLGRRCGFWILDRIHGSFPPGIYWLP